MKIRLIFIIISLLFVVFSSFAKVKKYVFNFASLQSFDFSKIKVIESDNNIMCFYLDKNSFYQIHENNETPLKLSDKKGWYISDGGQIISINEDGFYKYENNSLVPMHKQIENNYNINDLLIPTENIWTNTFNLTSTKSSFLILSKNLSHYLFTITMKGSVTLSYNINLHSRFIKPSIYLYQFPNGLIQHEEAYPITNNDPTVFMSKNNLFSKELQFCDLNFDNKKDILIGEKKGISVYLNQGANVFKEKKSFFIKNLFLYKNIEIFDVNGDGYLDIVSIRRKTINYVLEIKWGNKKGSYKNVDNLNIYKKILRKIIPLNYGFHDINNDGKYEFIYVKYKLKGMSPIGFAKKIIKEGIDLQVNILKIKNFKYKKDSTFEYFSEFQPFPFFLIDNLDEDRSIEFCLIKKNQLNIYRLLGKKRYSVLPKIKIPKIENYFIQKVNGYSLFVAKIKNKPKVLVISFKTLI